MGATLCPADHSEVDLKRCNGIALEVWITACEMPGERIAGQPIDYLCAMLRNKQMRGTGKVLRNMRFEELDHLSDQAQ